MTTNQLIFFAFNQELKSGSVQKEIKDDKRRQCSVRDGTAIIYTNDGSVCMQCKRWQKNVSSIE